MKIIIAILLLLPLDSMSQTRFLEGQTVFGDMVQPDPSAIFQVETTTQGFLPPRMTTAQRDELLVEYGTLPVGLQIYNTTESGIQVWNGAGWIGFLGGVVGFGEKDCAALWADDSVPELISSLLCITANVLEIKDSDNPLDEVPMVLRGQNEAGVVIEDAVKVEGRLEVESTTLASRPCPQMTILQRDAIVSPTLGDCITNTDINALEVYDGTAWGSVGGGGLDAWETSQPYEVGDVVFVEFQSIDRIYVANVDHTSDATSFATDIANWDLLADASVTVIDGEVFADILEIGTSFRFTDGVVVDDVIEDLSLHTATSLATSSSINTAIEDAADEKLDKIATSTDNALTLWDGATGDAVKDSGITATEPTLGEWQLNIDNLQISDGSINQTVGPLNITSATNMELFGTGTMTASFLDDVIVETLADIILDSENFSVNALGQVELGNAIRPEQILNIFPRTNITTDDGRVCLYGGGSAADPTRGALFCLFGANSAASAGKASIVPQTTFEVLSDGGTSISTDYTTGKVTLAETEVLGSLDAVDIQSGNVNQRNQFKDPFFFRDTSEWTCSAASPACELSLTQANVLEGVNSLAFTLEENEFIFANFTLTDSQKKAELKARINYLASSGDMSFIIQRDAAIVEEFDLLASDWSNIGYYLTGNDADNITLAIQCNSATCSGSLDDVYFGRFDVATASFRNCEDDFSCANEFSFRFEGGTSPFLPTKQAPSGWVTGCTRPSTGNLTCTIAEGVFDAPPTCTVGNFVGTSYHTVFPVEPSETAIQLRNFLTTSSSTPTNDGFRGYVHCRRGDDYKPLRETGVVTREEFIASVTAWGANGVGSDSGNRIRRFSNFEQNGEKFVEYTDSVTEGASFEILQDGYYIITYTDSSGGSDGRDFCIGKNLTDLSTVPASQGESCVGTQTMNSANHRGSSSFSGNLKRGDVIRGALTDTTNSSVPLQTRFSITKLPFAQILADLDQKLEYGEKGTSSRTCVIRQTSTSSTAAFESLPDGCADFSGASRLSEGTYGNFTYTSGFFKQGVKLSCSCFVSASVSSRRSCGVQFASDGDGVILPSSTFQIRAAGHGGTGNSDIDSGFHFECKGQKP